MACREAAEDQPLVSVLVGTRERPQAVLRCLQSVFGQNYPDLDVWVLDDGSKQQGICQMLSRQWPDHRIRCLQSDHPLGVAGGRNLLMQKARGEVLVVLDDDALFEDAGSIARIMAHFAQNPRVALLAFRVVTHRGEKVELSIPFSRRGLKRWPALSEEERLVSYFLGTGHALRRKVVEQCGGYQDDLVFGGEELDLSYRVVQAGMEILYCPDVVVHHFPQPSVVEARGAEGELYYRLRNRFWLAHRYLPWPYILTYLAVWAGHDGISALRRRQWGLWYRAVRDGISGAQGLRRSPLDARAIRYLKANFGRLWY